MQARETAAITPSFAGAGPAATQLFVERRLGVALLSRGHPGLSRANADAIRGVGGSGPLADVALP